MKFTKHIPRNDERKIITKFLWFPVTINHYDHLEIRWLEKATIEYIFSGRYYEEGSWTPYRFIDKE